MSLLPAIIHARGLSSQFLRSLTLAVVATGLGLSLAACGKSEGQAEGVAQAAPAAPTKSAQELAIDAAVEKAKKDREEKAAAAKAKEEELAAKVEEITTVPAKLPKNLKSACSAMTKAYDTFMLGVLEGDGLTKWKTGGNAMQLKLFGDQCLKHNVEAAACQTEALAKMTPELVKQLPSVISRCVEKYDPAK